MALQERRSVDRSPGMIDKFAQSVEDFALTLATTPTPKRFDKRRQCLLEGGPRLARVTKNIFPSGNASKSSGLKEGSQPAQIGVNRLSTITFNDENVAQSYGDFIGAKRETKMLAAEPSEIQNDELDGILIAAHNIDSVEYLADNEGYTLRLGHHNECPEGSEDIARGGKDFAQERTDNETEIARKSDKDNMDWKRTFLKVSSASKRKGLQKQRVLANKFELMLDHGSRSSTMGSPGHAEDYENSNEPQKASSSYRLSSNVALKAGAGKIRNCKKQKKGVQSSIIRVSSTELPRYQLPEPYEMSPGFKRKLRSKLGCSDGFQGEERQPTGHTIPTRHKRQYRHFLCIPARELTLVSRRDLVENIEDSQEVYNDRIVRRATSSSDIHNFKSQEFGTKGVKFPESRLLQGDEDRTSRDELQPESTAQQRIYGEIMSETIDCIQPPITLKPTAEEHLVTGNEESEAQIFANLAAMIRLSNANCIEKSTANWGSSEIQLSTISRHRNEKYFEEDPQESIICCDEQGCKGSSVETKEDTFITGNHLATTPGNPDIYIMDFKHRSDPIGCSARLCTFKRLVSSEKQIHLDGVGLEMSTAGDQFDRGDISEIDCSQKEMEKEKRRQSQHNGQSSTPIGLRSMMVDGFTEIEEAIEDSVPLQDVLAVEEEAQPSLAVDCPIKRKRTYLAWDDDDFSSLSLPVQRTASQASTELGNFRWPLTFRREQNEVPDSQSERITGDDSQFIHSPRFLAEEIVRRKTTAPRDLQHHPPGKLHIVPRKLMPFMFSPRPRNYALSQPLSTSVQELDRGASSCGRSIAAVRTVFTQTRGRSLLRPPFLRD